MKVRLFGRPTRAGSILAVVIALLVVGLLGSGLGRGYVLTHDMVFVPRQSFLPGFFGLGGGLPRAVPQDAIVAALTHLAPGWVWQHLALVAAIALAGLGASRLIRTEPLWVRCSAATLAGWNPWFVERLYQGHWALLLGYAVLPWAMAAARDVRRTRPGATARLLVWIALGSLVATSGLMVLIVSVPVAVIRATAIGRRTKSLVLLGGLVLQLPWLVPSLINPALSSRDSGGVSAFGLRPEGSWGTWITALGLGGFWNSEVAPGTRGSVLALLVAAALVILVGFGWRSYRRILGRAVAYSLAGSAAAGWICACVAATPAGQRVLVWLIDHIAGAGLLRDTHKLLAPLALLIAVAAPLGVARLIVRLADPAVRGVLIAGLLAAPFIALPDAVWGGVGRLDAVTYPHDWFTVRNLLHDDTRVGDVAVLPWSTFRSFAWNDHRTVLDPAPRWMPRSSVTADTLFVLHGPTLVAIEGEDPRAARISSAIEAGRPLAPALAADDVRFVLNELGTPESQVPPNLAGLTPLYRGTDLEVYVVPSSTTSSTPTGWHVLAVALADLLAIGVLTFAFAVMISASISGAIARRRGR